jgi:hypothetical protein
MRNGQDGGFLRLGLLAVEVVRRESILFVVFRLFLRWGSYGWLTSPEQASPTPGTDGSVSFCLLNLRSIFSLPLGRVCGVQAVEEGDFRASAAPVLSERDIRGTPWYPVHSHMAESNGTGGGGRSEGGGGTFEGRRWWIGRLFLVQVQYIKVVAFFWWHSDGRLERYGTLSLLTILINVGRVWPIGPQTKPKIWPKP